MRVRLCIATSLTAFALLTAPACKPAAGETVDSDTKTQENATMSDNPLLAEWTGPYGGVPDRKSVV